MVSRDLMSVESRKHHLESLSLIQAVSCLKIAVQREGALPPFGRECDPFFRGSFGAGLVAADHFAVQN